MLSKLKIHNVLCIYALNINFLFDKRAPSGFKDSSNLYFIESKDTRVVPVFGMYGANGSGKSTILKSLNVLKHIVENGLKKGVFVPNRIIDNRVSDFSEICVEFYKNNNQFNYTLKYDDSRIIFERLTFNHEDLFIIDNSTLNHGFNLEQSVIDTFYKRCVYATSNNQIKTFLFELPDAFPGLNKELLEAKEYICDDLLVFQANSQVRYFEGIKSLANTYKGPELDNIRLATEQIVDYLERLDIGIHKIIIVDSSVHGSMNKLVQKNEGSNNLSDFVHNVYEKNSESADASPNISYDICTTHKSVTDKEVIFDIQYESSGTKNLIGLLGEILAAVRLGKTVLIDDIDESLHSLLVREIVKIFKAKRINENGAQLIFTSHNPEILDLIAPTELGIVLNQKPSGSIVKKVSDFHPLKGKRTLRDAYINGELGGVPYPYV